MKYLVEIECDNDAFAEYPGEEVSHILSALSERVKSIDPGDGIQTILFDVNGARVGVAQFVEV